MDELLAKLRSRMREEAQHRDVHAEQIERAHRRYIAQQVERALTANLKLWLDMNTMHQMPEAFGITVIENTGLQGGDSGHGGQLAIRFQTDSGCNAIAFRPSERALVDRDGFEGEVTLTARGDWEQDGLISGLASLLLALLDADQG